MVEILVPDFCDRNAVEVRQNVPASAAIVIV
jgi:hypothetical protein